MYVTRILVGRPYQCYIPKPLIPQISDHFLCLFQGIDRCLASSLHDESFMESMARTVVQPNNRLDSFQAIRNAQQAAEASLNALGIKQLQKANALLLGLPSSEFRVQPVWLGAPHPGLSWHVGSPPEMIPTLVKQLLCETSLLNSPSLAAVILLFRLLQIHPFVDGNGRTARYWAIRHIQQNIGPACAFLSLIDSLWDRKNFDINAISLVAQEEKSLDPIFASIERRIDLKGSNSIQ